MSVANTDIFFALKVVKSNRNKKKGSVKMIKEKRGGYYESEYSDGLLVVRIKGEIDHHSAVAVRSAIDAKLYEFRPRHAVLDLSKIDFMDSSGLGLIMGRYALMQKLGGRFSIANPNERVMKIFDLAGLGRIITVEKNGEENEKAEETK